MTDLDKLINDACYWYYLRQWTLNEELMGNLNIKDLKEKELTERLLNIIERTNTKW